jgi:hypothetical protein
MIFNGCICLRIETAVTPSLMMMIEGEDRPSKAIEDMHLISHVFIWYMVLWTREIYGAN